MTDDDIKLAGELAKAATDSALEPIKEQVTNLFSPFTKEVGLLFALPAQLWRFKAKVIIAEKAMKFLNNRGVKPQPVPIKLLLPVLENGCLEEDESMIDHWATLLANAADPNATPSILPSYASILKDLSPLEAKVLDSIYGGIIEHPVHRSQWRNFIVTAEQILKEAPIPSENFQPGFWARTQLRSIFQGRHVQVGCISAPVPGRCGIGMGLC